MSLHVVILAAGNGKRMLSTTPKVLHHIGGLPMLVRVINTAQSLDPDMIHVIHSPILNEFIQNARFSMAVNWVLQDKPRGTGHALLQVIPQIPLNARVLILSADVPLIKISTLHALILQKNGYEDNITPLVLLVANIDKPQGCGRILRNTKGEICAIIEEKEASFQQKQIKEIYSGICVAKAYDLAAWLPKLEANNAQGEYYLTDIVSMAAAASIPIISLLVDDPIEIQGVNDKVQLAKLERIWQTRQAFSLLLNGVLIADPARIDIRGELICEEDVFIDVNCVFIGKVKIGKGTHIGPNCVITDTLIGDDCYIFANCVMDCSTISNSCKIGPFAHLRLGTSVDTQGKIGNFVETKNAMIGKGSKAGHLSYLGDVTIGNQVNIGAGTIICNYDGVNKHPTTIKDGAFIGSGTQLVAPVTVGANATIGAGSTIRKDAPAEELSLTVSLQKTIKGWKRPVKSNA